jgi:hypothetical protein
MWGYDDAFCAQGCMSRDNVRGLVNGIDGMSLTSNSSEPLLKAREKIVC